MRWPFQRRSEHHVSRFDFLRCCCGWNGVTTNNLSEAFDQWDSHADHRRLTEGPCTRGETS